MTRRTGKTSRRKRFAAHHFTPQILTDPLHPQFKLKQFEDRDIDIAIECCGVCGSDVHTINGGWGDCPLPICVGHEVVGKAIKVGKDVKTIKVGDRVGVGAQIGADLTCNNCKADQENYCPNSIDTFGAPYKDGTISQGGYASHIRAHEYFTFKIPDALESEVAAPMLCAGVTGNAASNPNTPLTSTNNPSSLQPSGTTRRRTRQEDRYRRCWRSRPLRRHVRRCSWS